MPGPKQANSWSEKEQESTIEKQEHHNTNMQDAMLQVTGTSNFPLYLHQL